MGLSQASIFLLTFLAFGALVFIVKKNRNLDQDVIEYKFGFKEFEDDYDDNPSQYQESGLLHVQQVLKKVDNNEFTSVFIDFPKNVSGSFQK
jgi:hypothetical protein